MSRGHPRQLIASAFRKWQPNQMPTRDFRALRQEERDWAMCGVCHEPFKSAKRAGFWLGRPGTLRAPELCVCGGCLQMLGAMSLAAESVARILNRPEPKRTKIGRA